MNRKTMVDRYDQLKAFSHDPDTWLDSQFGGDLWVDGLNVFLTIEREDFIEALERFLQRDEILETFVMRTLQSLHQFCMDAAKCGEFELYQALSVGLTWLSLQAETSSQFFNVPVMIANHSTALLLSPTYQAVWAHSYNAGLELYVDLETRKPSLFRPEHGRIYQRSSSYTRGNFVKYPFQSYFHEMSHILLFYDTYQRVLGTVEEERSLWTHMEACISGLEERMLADLLAVGYELNLIDDGFGDHGGYPEAGSYRIRVVGGLEEPVMSGRALDCFMKQYMQRGEGETFIPENPLKATILQNHQVSDVELESIWPHYETYMRDLQRHSLWGIQSAARNRIPAFREVVELLPLDSYCTQKIQECLDPQAWQTLEELYSKNPWPETDPEHRQRNRQMWRWRDLLSRIAEMRGYLSQVAAGESNVLTELFTHAQTAAQVISACEPLSLTMEQHEQRIDSLKRAIHDTLQQLQDKELRARLWELIHDPFTYLLEPR